MVHHLPAGNVKVNCGFATKQHDYHQKWWFYNKKNKGMLQKALDINVG